MNRAADNPETSRRQGLLENDRGTQGNRLRLEYA